MNESITNLFGIPIGDASELECLIRISDREELLLQDCEWKIRETERNCKKRVDAAEVAKKDALQKSEEVAVNAKTQTEQVSTERELLFLGRVTKTA